MVYQDSELVTYIVFGASGGLLAMLCIVQHNIRWFQACFRSMGCDCCTSASIAPENGFQRQPTSAERIYAMAALVNANPGTKLSDLIEIMVQGPPRNGSEALPPVQLYYAQVAQVTQVTQVT